MKSRFAALERENAEMRDQIVALRKQASVDARFSADRPRHAAFDRNNITAARPHSNCPADCVSLIQHAQADIAYNFDNKITEIDLWLARNVSALSTSIQTNKKNLEGLTLKPVCRSFQTAPTDNGGGAPYPDNLHYLDRQHVGCNSDEFLQLCTYEYTSAPKGSTVGTQHYEGKC